jgi:hypothetical protein
LIRRYNAPNSSVVSVSGFLQKPSAMKRTGAPDRRYRPRETKPQRSLPINEPNGLSLNTELTMNSRFAGRSAMRRIR